MSTPVPQPRGYPVLGNITDIDPKAFAASLVTLSKKYGEIFKLTTLGVERYFVCSERLTRELCDETKFNKLIVGALLAVRDGVGDGLFTAHYYEENWGKAHRILTPAFGPIGIKNMFDGMYDIATQLLALDTLALCTMDKRFNSFYSTEMHPFVEAMTEFLRESAARARKTRVELMLNQAANRKYFSNIKLMRDIAQEVIDKRRKQPSDKKDFLSVLLFGKDPKTGESLSDECIMNNMIIFLIAGHETTSGLLSFTTWHLLKNPDALQKLQKEVDEVVGTGPIKYEHMSKLPYLEAVLRESLRIHPPAPLMAFKQKPEFTEPFVLGGEYLIPANASVLCVPAALHRDTAIWGEDAEQFKPERMYGENFERLPQHAWKPFGNGSRGCIGRPLAWQEATLALALVIQNFNFRMADPQYTLQIRQAMSIKPEDFCIKVSLRPGVDPINLEKKLFGHQTKQELERTELAAISDTANLKPMTVLYGSNSGTCEGLSQKLAMGAAGHGYAAKVMTLDAAVDKFPTDHPVVLISASYEGQPPDNAGLFVKWLQESDPSKFKNAQYAVFGCGHRDWVTTYQRIPVLLDSVLSQYGAKIILPRGSTNVAGGTIFDDFDAWADKFWLALGSTTGTTDDALELELSSNSRATHLRYSLQDAVVLKNEALTPAGVKAEKRYIELQLPTQLTYEVGDYLALLPINDFDLVARILRRFGLPWDATMTLKKGSHSTIPGGVELSVSLVLASYVELNQACSKKSLELLAKYTEQGQLENAAGLSPLDILEAHPGLNISFASYLSLLAPMRIRQYSISSSPLHDPSVASITFSMANDTDSRHPGVATSYLKKLKPGITIKVAIRKSPAPFHPPVSPSTPILMACAGSGLAPFRGFVQDRAIKMAAAKDKSEFAPAILLVGCRSPDTDRIHGAELDEWERQGVVKVYRAYSRAPDHSEGCKHVQDRLWKEREEISALFKSGAKAYICGSSAMGNAINDMAAKMRVLSREGHPDQEDLEQARKWWDGLRGERFAVDVFD